MVQEMLNEITALLDQYEIDWAITCYQLLITRFLDSEIPEVQVRVARAMFSRAFIMDAIESLAQYDRLITRFEDNDNSEVLKVVGSAKKSQRVQDITQTT